jgi:hypothetical protein
LASFVTLSFSGSSDARQALESEQDYCAFFRGLRTSSPPQFGHVDCMAWVQSAQKVHSKVQMKAFPVGDSGAWHFSH